MNIVSHLLRKVLYKFGFTFLTKNEYIWYASYGSNCFRERFYCYLRGGQTDGNSTVYPGCSDKSLPLDERNLLIPHALYFAKQSASWENGGVGFIRHQKNENEKTFGKMYLITKNQFGEIVKQETKREENLTIDFVKAQQQETLLILERSWYGMLLYLGTAANYPIFTFTNSSDSQPFVKPSSRYLKTISKGIQKNFDLNPDELVDYFISRPGISDNYTRQEIQEIVRTIKI
ncbi:hypothetical protein [Pseudochryseolinea flava]|uniref:Gamma-glutamylcyclotransferase n=1 Tax=Pseudochryseolinea flava TaxID=2059302 RepID=A0A364XTB8_9BACT|nr:hypothetical protein [Pseudochryseolinea flava]RAV97609.1 hypothetical protein DQQ10_27570 [Pseudochryseolinea flava]